MSNTIKDIFEKSENGTLTYEQFEALAKEKDAKFADLSDGKYVSKSKYDSDIKAVNAQIEALNGQIETLNGTITARDTDLADLQKQLEAAGEDATKLAELGTNLSALQDKYDKDTQAYQSKLKQQSYEFAVKEYANTQKFTSKAAKRDFVKAMIEKNLQMEGDKLIGADDFKSVYASDNDDAFVVEKEPEPTPAPTPTAPVEPKVPVPTMVASTPGNTTGNEDSFNFGFVGVRAHE